MWQIIASVGGYAMAGVLYLAWRHASLGWEKALHEAELDIEMAQRERDRYLADREATEKAAREEKERLTKANAQLYQSLQSAHNLLEKVSSDNPLALGRYAAGVFGALNDFARAQAEFARGVPVVVPSSEPPVAVGTP